jgi:hypothetical protein
MIRFIIEQVVDVVDSRRERERATEQDWKADIAARVAAIEANERASIEIRVTRDREIRDIKGTVKDMDGKLDQLVADKAGRDTAISFGKWIVGTGFFGIVGSVIIATLHYIGWLRPPA